MTARILVVDDVPFNVKLLETKLRQEYYSVTSASNGKEAISQAKEVMPDLILMDIMMPEMDGFEATKIIKSTPKLAHIPIIMVTALNAQEDKVAGLEAGADDFISKPIDDQALLVRLRSLVRLKLMTDELRLRSKASHSFGLLGQEDLKKINKIENSKVLLVDDNAEQINIISEKLADNNISLNHCSQADDVANLLSSQEEQEYSLIILSAQLSGTDILALCSQIRSNSSIRHIPILLIVESNSNDLVNKSLEMGVNDYLVSPLDPNEVLARVSTQIKRFNYQNALKARYINSLSLSVTDPLTKLYNRRYFDRYLNEVIVRSKEAARPLSLIIIDIDYFKRVNDTYGHQAGDEVIKQVAEILINNTRATDLCSRLGGEEFAIIVPGISMGETLEIAERLRNIVENYQFHITDGEEVKCTLSIGISCLEDEDTDFNLIRKADRNLYKAKEKGRNQVIS